MLGGRGRLVRRLSKLDSVETKRGRVCQGRARRRRHRRRADDRLARDQRPRVDDGVVVNERFETGAPRTCARRGRRALLRPAVRRRTGGSSTGRTRTTGAEVGQLIAGDDGALRHRLHLLLRGVRDHVQLFGDVDDFDEIVFRGTLEEAKAIGFYLAATAARCHARRRPGRRDGGAPKELIRRSARPTTLDEPRARRGDNASRSRTTLLRDAARRRRFVTERRRFSSSRRSRAAAVGFVGTRWRSTRSACAAARRRARQRARGSATGCARPARPRGAPGRPARRPAASAPSVRRRRGLDVEDAPRPASPSVCAC